MGTPQAIAVDLDGTCVRYVPRFELDPVFINHIRPLLGVGVVWIMNSDRPVECMVEIAEYLTPEERPLAILSRQQHIYLLADDKKFYMPYDEWNNSQELLHSALWGKLSPFIPEWEKEIDRRFSVTGRFVGENDFAFSVPSQEQELLRAHIMELIEPFDEAQLSGNDVWSFVLHAEFSKARVLRECAKIFEIETSRIITVGDGINDLSMLDGSVTPLVGCPANSASEVKAAVAAANGFISESEAAAGTVEVIAHHMAGGGK